MAKKDKVKFEEVQAVPDDVRIVNRAKGFWAQNNKPIMIASLVLIAAALGYIGYNKLYKEPREQKAADAIWKAQQYFQMDSLTLALNGDGASSGFEKVAKNFSGTKAGNLAKFYAGVIYLRQNNFNKAVEYLKNFSTDGREVQAIAYTRLGDAYSELNKNEEAVQQYLKAAAHYPEQENISADALFRAGLKYETMGKTAEAIKAYKQIKEKYARTDKGFTIDKYLARLGVYE